MSTVLVAVGSTRTPKLAAVREALARLGPMLAPEAKLDVFGVEVPSGVGHTPLSRAELRAGARSRCRALQQLAGRNSERWRYFVGLEGGVSVEQEGTARLAFVENWACVADTAGRVSYGHSGGVLLPEPLAADVIDRGTELAAAIDAYAHGHGIRDAQGTWGILTRNLLNRQDSFCIAVINAFAPFYNSALYPER